MPPTRGINIYKLCLQDIKQYYANYVVEKLNMQGFNTWELNELQQWNLLCEN